jgi:protoheme IX farnesyltransferase
LFKKLSFFIQIRWRKTATSTKLVDNEDSPSISSQPLSKSTPLQPQHVQNFNNNQEQRTTTTLPITSSSSTTPLKLHNAVDPTYLKQVVAESHALDYSKLPSYYLSLSKSRLTGLVVITAMAGYAMAPASFALLPFTALTLGTALTSASANTINQIMEVEYDGQMDRTKNRVLVQRNLR